MNPAQKSGKVTQVLRVSALQERDPEFKPQYPKKKKKKLN
jgi:hypothetical protein